MHNENILAIDPGKDKVGIAILNEKGELLEKMIIFVSNTKDFVNKISSLINEYKIKYCAIGNGTKSKEYTEMVIESGIEKPCIVDERNTTLLAREKYFLDFPPRGLKRLIPISFQVPAIPLDAYAAVIIGERYLNLYFKGDFDET